MTDKKETADTCEHTCDGTNVCTKCGLYNAGKGEYVCRNYDKDEEVKGACCRICGFNVMLHGWNK